MSELIERLEKAGAPDAGLDSDIFEAAFGPGASFPANCHGRFTDSLEDAMALAPAGLSDYVIWTHKNPKCVGAELTFTIKPNKNEVTRTFDGYGATRGIAVTIAAMKARAVLRPSAN